MAEASIAAEGVGSLGLCLSAALQKIQSEKVESEGDVETATTPILLDAIAAQNILSAFGEAVLETQNDTHPRGPEGKLQGDLKHYTRIGQNWRFVVDDATIEQNHRNVELPYLPKRTPEEGDVLSVGEVQILTFGDL